jgi:hypothetical protein
VLNANVYREFSAEFGGGANALANGTLILSGLEFRVTDGFINGGLTREVYFNNIKGAGSETINFEGFNMTAVPIPSAILLLGGGLISLFAVRRRRK